MGDVKDLSNQEAIEKIKKLVKEIDVCLFCTNGAEGNGIPFDTRPMSTQDVDDEGNLWFLSDKNSNKDQQIKQDDKVQLLYSNNSNANYLSIDGHAEVYYDRDKIEKLWSPIAKAWMTGGKDDPNLSVICVRPAGAYYWDNKHGKFIALIKIVGALVSGKTMDDGIEGKMEL